VFRCGSPGSSRPWRGFPIRTPWDHSPVIDSPRLIADSYVLLRLLMPRHPPCALKNLTTKDQGVIFERTMKTYPHPKARIRSRFIFLEIASYKRCSRPLCSSQTTTPYHPPAHTLMHDRRSQETRNTSPGSHLPVLLPQDPTVCQTRNHHPPPAPFHAPPPKKRHRTKHRRKPAAAIR
jgi:hypothetical protein